MNKTTSMGLGIAAIIFVGTYIAGALLLRTMAENPELSPAKLLAVSDVVRMLGPILSGYAVGYALRKRGILWAFLFSLGGFVLIESIGHPPWYYEYDYFEFAGVSFFTHFGLPAALAGGCGQLHSLLNTQGASK